MHNDDLKVQNYHVYYARFERNKKHQKKARQLMVQFNIEQGIIEKEEQLAVDTTHVEAEATLNANRKCGHSEPCDCPKIPTDDNVGLLRSPSFAV